METNLLSTAILLVYLGNLRFAAYNTLFRWEMMLQIVNDDLKLISAISRTVWKYETGVKCAELEYKRSV